MGLIFHKKFGVYLESSRGGHWRVSHSCNLHFNWAVVGKVGGRLRLDIDRLVKRQLEFSK